MVVDHNKLILKLITSDPNLNIEPKSQVDETVVALVNGQFNLVIKDPIIASFFNSEIPATKGDNCIEIIDLKIKEFVNSNDAIYTIILASTFLQLFTQLNITGPVLPDFLPNSWIVELGNKNLKTHLLNALMVQGITPYHLCESPEWLIISIKLLEIQLKSTTSIISSESHFDSYGVIINDNISATSAWILNRALQVYLSILPEESWSLTTLSLSLLNSDVINIFNSISGSLKKQINIMFHLERAKCSLGQLDSQTNDELLLAKKESGVEWALTGIKAKLTKYQRKATDSLVLLAKSLLPIEESNSFENIVEGASGGINAIDEGGVKNVNLNDDLFLEKPYFVTDEEAAAEEQLENSNKQIINVPWNGPETEEEKPYVGIVGELMPPLQQGSTLSQLDPNNPSALNQLDTVLLLLLLNHLLSSQNSSSFLNEQLISIVQRILFSPSGSVNWLIYSKSLWFRSIMETIRARTVERGVLQLYSLVEELGMQSKFQSSGRLFPQTQDEIEFPNKFSSLINEPLLNSNRLKFAHLLPLTPFWKLDDELASKLMELGSIKSALAIYERLEQYVECSICLSALDQTDEAIECLNKAIQLNPKNARAISILGDIKQDPTLWEKSWQLARYPNAKRSLAKYYQKNGNIQLAIDHMFDCLCVKPLDFANWYYYGCLGLECENWPLGAEAFTRCVSIDESNIYCWSNLATCLIQLDKLDEALNALQKAVIDCKNWQVWENYLTVALKLGKYIDSVDATIKLLELRGGQGIDLNVIEKLTQILTSRSYNPEASKFGFQTKCIDLIVTKLPGAINDSSLLRNIAKIDLWRGQHALALQDYEKLYRISINHPELQVDEKIWNDAVASCQELVSAYENLGEMEGRWGAGDLICKDWKFKAKSAVRGLLSKGKVWTDTEGWEMLKELKSQVMNN